MRKIIKQCHYQGKVFVWVIEQGFAKDRFGHSKIRAKMYLKTPWYKPNVHIGTYFLRFEDVDSWDDFLASKVCEYVELNQPPEVVPYLYDGESFYFTLYKDIDYDLPAIYVISLFKGRYCKYKHCKQIASYRTNIFKTTEERDTFLMKKLVEYCKNNEKVEEYFDGK